MMDTVGDEWRRDNGFFISTRREWLDLDVICEFLQNQSYWAQGRSRDIITRSVENSLAFGVYKGEHGAQIGFCRVITDYATFGWVADVFILPEYRGLKLGEWLIETVVAHRDLQGLRRLVLATRDAHGLYAKYGFHPLENADRWMSK